MVVFELVSLLPHLHICMDPEGIVVQKHVALLLKVGGVIFEDKG